MRHVPENSVKANRIVRQYTQSIPADVDDIFALLCPVREKAWLEGWNYNMIHSESGYAEQGCVFTTRNGEKEATWVITRRDPESGGDGN